MATVRRELLLSGLAVAALAAGIAAWCGDRLSRTVFTDGQSIRERADVAQVREMLWQPPERLSESINTQSHEYEPRLSSDGLSLYFVRGKPGENADLFICTRVSRGWSEPTPVAGINSEADELGPQLSADGSTLYFYSNRKDGLGGYDLWRAKRTETAWAAPENLGAGINTGWNEYSPSIAPDGTAMFFASNRPQTSFDQTTTTAPIENWPATIRENSQAHDYNLYTAPMLSGDIGEPSAIVALNTLANEGTPSFSPAGDFLYFSSDRAGGQGGFDLYRSRWLRGRFEPAENLGLSINSVSNDLDPALSMDGFAMHWSSDREAVSGGKQRPQYDVYFAVSREVFKDVEPSDGINWASLLATVLPNLLWLLLGLLLVLLFLRFVRSGKMKALSLLTRCILLSLLAHVLLMMLFMIWGVTVGLADAIKRGGAIQVGLTSSSVGQGSGVFSQVRGETTEVQLAPQKITSERQHTAGSPEPIEIRGVQVSQQPKPLRLTDRMQVTQPQTRDAPSRTDQASISIMADVPVQRAPLVNTRTPMVNAGESVSETSIAQLRAEATDSRQAPSTNIEAPRSTIVQTKVDGISGSSLRQTTSMQSIGGTAAVQDASPSNAPSDSIPQGIDLPRTESVSSVSLPKAEPGANSTATEAQSSLPGAVGATGGAGRASTTVAPIEVGGRLIQSGGTAPLAIEEAGSSLAGPAGATVADATPSGSGAANNSPSLIDVPALASSSDMPGLRTPSDSAVKTSGSNIEEAQAVMSAAGGQSVSAGKFDAAPAPEAAAGSSITVSPDPGHVLGSGDSGSLAINGSTNLATDAATPSSIGLAGPDADVALLPIVQPGDVGLRLPSEIAPPVEAYKQRAAENRMDLVKDRGGSEATERAVELSLKWLAAHQNADGRWDADHFDDGCRRCGSPARFDADVATTGLALLCYLAANHTHTHDGPYRDNVQRALNWLMAEQKPTGDLRGNETMYSHGIGSIALSEAYGMTRDEALLPHVRRAINFIVNARDTSDRDGSPSAGGWRYEPGQAGDTSVLGWQVMALVSAKRAGVEVPDEALQAARNWLDRVSPDSNPGLYSYQPGERFSVAMTAEGMFSQQLLGRSRDEPRMIGSADFITRTLPNWRNEPNTYYWYYATLALFQHQGDVWEKWNAAITEQLLDNQHTSGAKAGSWDPLDRWSKIGGRIYQTAMCTLCLEVYYRYLPLYGPHVEAQKAP